VDFAGNGGFVKKYGSELILLLQTLILSAVCLFFIAPVSCKITEEGIRITGGDYTAPAIEAVTVLDEKSVRMSFSERVKLNSVVISKMLKDVSDSMEHSSSLELSPAIAAANGQADRIEASVELSEDGQSITYLMENACEIGSQYEIFGVVEDRTGNTLTFCVPFVGFNSRIPDLLMTEIQIKYSKSKGEFVELLALSNGNLGGLELTSGVDGNSKKYEFPAVEVTAGEIILVHLRSTGESCVNELGDNTSLASAPYSVDGIRDLWSENTVARFNDNADVILLRNGEKGPVLDAFMYASESMTEWKKGADAYARLAVEAGIYPSAEITEASVNQGSSYAKSFHRLNAAQFRSLVLNGDEYEYPVRVNADSWGVGPVTEGTL